MANRPSRFGFGRRDKRALWRFGMKKGRRCRSWYAPLARCCGSDRGGAGGGARTICNALHDRGLGFRRAPRPGRNSGIWREMGVILRLALRPKTALVWEGFLSRANGIAEKSPTLWGRSDFELSHGACK